MKSYSVQVKSVWPGKIGGAIFKGNVLGESLSITCKASHKVIDRSPEIGELWSVSGSVSNHSEYGSQLNITEAFIVSLPSPSYLEALLMNHPVFRGFHLGKAKITQLTRTFGTTALMDYLNNSNIAELSTVINELIAKKLVESWHTLSNEIETLNFLREHNFHNRLIKEILKISKINTVARLKNNPYSLICFYQNSEKLWKTIEATARKLGISTSDSRRLIGAVEYVLYRRLAEGHTATRVSTVLTALNQIQLNPRLAEEAIAEALCQKNICAFSKNSETHLQLISAAYIEHSIETKIEALLQSPASEFSRTLIDRTVKSYARAFISEYKYPLSSQQEDAIKVALTERCAMLSGFGGTGKTTTLRAVGDICSSLGRPVILLALSGKAKERLAEATGRNAMTLHSFIIGVNNGTIAITSDPLIVVDEASMVDPTLFNRLLDAFKGSAYSLLMVGDTAQLSPIGFGLVWHKMVESNRIKAIHLTEVYRQLVGSPLHNEAMLVREGLVSKLPILRDNAHGIYLEEAEIFNLSQKLISLKRKYPDAQIITPFVSSKDSDGTEILNEVLQEHLNPFDSSDFNIAIADCLLRKNDPVIFTRNSYDLNLFNGMTGLIEEILLSSEQKRLAKVKLTNSEETRLLNEDELHELGTELAYAISVHKSQGSEYPKVFVCCVRDTTFMERSLIYTAITRAKDLCVVVGSQSNYSKAVANPPRGTTLCVGINL